MSEGVLIWGSEFGDVVSVLEAGAGEGDLAGSVLKRGFYCNNQSDRILSL